jgi:hypothetical protein
VGSPAQTIAEAGAVQVIYGSADGLAAAGAAMVLASELWHQERQGVQDTPKPGEAFGAAVTAGDFNGDGRSDLAVAVPFEDGGAGAVQIFFGSAGGLSGGDDLILTAADLGVTGPLFGDFDVTLAWGNFDADQFGDLVVGAPHASVGSDTDAGAVHIVYGSANGPNPARRQTWHQDQLGTLAQAEPNDNFGSALAAGDFDDDDLDDLAVGVRNEDPDGQTSADNAGEVDVLYGAVRTGLRATAAQKWNLNVTGVTGDLAAGDQFGGALAAGDFNGDAKDDLAVGAPSKGVKRSDGNYDDRAGTVTVIYGATPDGLRAYPGALVVAQQWHQNSVDDGSEIEDAVEPGDRFGSALAAGDFDNDGSDDLAVAAPSESIGSTTLAGAINVIYGDASEGLDASGDELFHQDRSGIDDDAEHGDFFGRGLSAWNFGNGDEDDLAVGVPSETAPVFLGGLVHAIYGDDSSGLTSSGSQLWTQDSEGVPDTVESKDTFGDPLARD